MEIWSLLDVDITSQQLKQCHIKTLSSRRMQQTRIAEKLFLAAQHLTDSGAYTLVHIRLVRYQSIVYLLLIRSVDKPEWPMGLIVIHTLIEYSGVHTTDRY